MSQRVRRTRDAEGIESTGVIADRGFPYSDNVNLPFLRIF
jgi:hypothetical protein